MAANDYLNRTLFHGTVRPGWDPTSMGDEDWIHIGTLNSATRRLSASARPGGNEESEWEDDDEEDEYGRPALRTASTHGDPRVYALRLRPDARVSNKVGPRPEDMGQGQWLYRDLGHVLQEGDNTSRIDALKETHDVIPYTNLDEGGTSFYVRASAVESSRPFKRYGRGAERFRLGKGLPWREGAG